MPKKAAILDRDGTLIDFHRDAGLVVLAVNQRDQELTTKAVQDFVREYGVDFPVALDNRGHTRRTFRLVGLPTLVFIDTAGVIQGVHPGPATRAGRPTLIATASFTGTLVRATNCEISTIETRGVPLAAISPG